MSNNDGSRQFANLSVGALALIVAAVIVLPVVLCLACCVIGGIGGSVTEP